MRPSFARRTPLLLVALAGACAPLGDGAAGLTAPAPSDPALHAIASGTIRIDCVGSIPSDTHPLFVVNGTVRGRDGFHDLSPADIESLEIVKGQAAAALYGSRGIEGVILITTKHGGPAHVSLAKTSLPAAAP